MLRVMMMIVKTKMSDYASSDYVDSEINPEGFYLRHLALGNL